MRRPPGEVLVVVAAALDATQGMTAGDPVRGQRVFQYCYSCHSVNPDETGLQGPSLARVVGRPVASQAGFDYSAAMREFALRQPVWTEEMLDRYIAAPDALVPKTAMEFHGVEDAAERADLIAYLRSDGRRP